MHWYGQWVLFDIMAEKTYLSRHVFIRCNSETIFSIRFVLLLEIWFSNLQSIVWFLSDSLLFHNCLFLICLYVSCPIFLSAWNTVKSNILPGLHQAVWGFDPFKWPSVSGCIQQKRYRLDLFLQGFYYLLANNTRCTMS